MYSQFWKKCQQKSLVPSIVRMKPTAVQTVSPMNQPLWNAAIVSNGWPRTTTSSSPTIRFIRRRLNSERSWKSIIYQETIFLCYSKKAIYLAPNKFCFFIKLHQVDPALWMKGFIYFIMIMILWNMMPKQALVCVKHPWEHLHFSGRCKETPWSCWRWNRAPRLQPNTRSRYWKPTKKEVQFCNSFPATHYLMINFYEFI